MTDSEDDFNALVFMAFRYALGRATYVPGWFCEIVRRHHDKLSRHTISLMVREITEAEHRGQGSPPPFQGPLGMPCDKQEWLSLREFLRQLPAKDAAA